MVVGAGVGGLSAAIHARLKGWDVLVVEQSDRCGGKAAGFEIGGFHLDPGPSIIILPEVYNDVFRAAGRTPEDYLRFQRLDTLSRVCFEGEDPLDLPADLTGCEDVLRRIAPNDLPAFQALMAKLDSCVAPLERAVFGSPVQRATDMMRPGLMGFGLRFNPFKNYKRMIDGWFESPLLRAFFYGFPSYGGQTYHDNAPGALLIPYYMLRRGVYFPEGGVRAIPRAFERLAREVGVVFRFGVKFEEFVGPAAFRTSEGEQIGADAIVCNVDKLTATKAEGLAPSMSYFTLHWGLNKALDGLEHHNLVIPRQFEAGFESLYRGNFPKPPIVYLNATARLDPEAAPPGCTNLFAVVTVPADLPELNWQARRDEYRDAVLAEVRKSGLSWRDDEVVFERVQDPGTFAQAHGNYMGSLYGPVQSQRHLGLFPLTNWDPNHPRRAYVGGSVQPGAGLPMVTLSGRFAVDALANANP